MIAAAIVPPGVAVALALIVGPEHLATATALCLLAVVGAAALGGLRSGIAAAATSFLALNFFFTVPRHTLIVSKASDVVALSVFLLCALIVGGLLTRAVDAQSRAERKATEAHLLGHTAARLVSGEQFERVLEDVAAALLDLFGLTRCTISTRNGTGTAEAPGGRPVPERTIVVELATLSGSFGSITAARDRDGPPFSMAETDLLRTLATQTALAVERAGLDAEVREARFAAEASRLRAALFSSVTHDLRTPLSSIKASVSGLLGPGVRYTDEQREELLRTVLEETDHLDSIVRNILDLARMRAGDLTISTQPVFVDDIIGSVLRRMRRALARTPVRTTFRPNLPPVMADPLLIGQAIWNVVENAVRFSGPDSEIEITAARWHDIVEVCVLDRGPGIPREERSRVFEEFYRRDAGRGRAGTGLGLAIARAVIAAHRASIRIDGRPGGGTAVVMQLPTAPLAMRPTPDRSRASERVAP